MKRDIPVLPKVVLLELFEELCKFHGMPPYGPGNPCAGDGLFWRSIERRLDACNVTVKDAEVVTMFDAYRAVCANHQRDVLKQRTAILRRLRVRGRS